MQLILKERRVARLGSLKVLDFATTRCSPACERWVDLTGLKQLFAIFMGKSKVIAWPRMSSVPLSVLTRPAAWLVLWFGCHSWQA